MSVKSSKNRFSYDNLLELRAASAAAITADTSSSILDLGTLKSYWDSVGDQSSMLQFAIVAEVSAYTQGGGPVDAILTVQTAITTDPTFAGTITPIESRTITGVGRWVIPITREMLVAQGYLRVLVDVGGTSPSVTVGIYVAPLTGD